MKKIITDKHYNIYTIFNKLLYLSLVLNLDLADLSKCTHLADTNVTHLTRSTRPCLNLEPGHGQVTLAPDSHGTRGNGWPLISRQQQEVKTFHGQTIDQVLVLSTLSSVQHSLAGRGRETRLWKKQFTRARVVLL